MPNRGVSNRATPRWKRYLSVGDNAESQPFGLQTMAGVARFKPRVKRAVKHMADFREEVVRVG